MNSCKRQSWRGWRAIGPAVLLLLVGIPMIDGLAAEPTGEHSNSQLLAGPSSPREQDAQRVLLSRCAVCHSTDLIVQQRLTREKWVATVSKMVHWGAQLSAGDEALVIDYLAERYSPGGVAAAGAGLPPDVSQVLSSSANIRPNFQNPPPGRVQQGQAVYRHNCLPCHGDAAVGGMGPRLAKNPVLTDEQRFWRTVWEGRGAMPAWSAMLSVQEIADIQAWLKSLE